MTPAAVNEAESSVRPVMTFHVSSIALCVRSMGAVTRYNVPATLAENL